MRTCGEYEDMISAFIDGALAERDRAALMEHMAACPACQEYFDQQIALHDALLADAEAICPPEDFAADVMARVRFTPQEKRKQTAVRLRRWPCGGAGRGPGRSMWPPGPRTALQSRRRTSRVQTAPRRLRRRRAVWTPLFRRPRRRGTMG